MAINPIKVWNGTAWEYTGPVVAAPPVKYQATAPTSPATGDVWVESDYDVASVDPSKLLTGGVYTNESTRSAAIPTPTTGMVTYVGDTGTETPSATIPQLEAYTGAAWQNLGGLTLLANVPFTSATTIAVDNVFTSTYENYRVVVNAFGSANVGTNFNFRKAGVANSGGFYGAGFYTQFSGGAANFNSANGTSTVSIAGFGTGGGTCVFDVCNPRGITGNSAVLQGQFHYQPSGYNAFFGYNIGHDTFDGFTLTCASGTFTGRIRVYGYRNA
jgi:hypothetical protein